jgi:lipopolysaccharide/colanic/teichoic acid biosynthesis glycosyltransferase
MYKNYGKRIFDIIASFCGLLLLSPVMIIIALIVKLSSKGPVLFVQKRVGKGFKEFDMYKFRSMVADAEKLGPSVTKGDDKRITKIGRFLRKTKLDELPQLWNVLKGDMSLVGPRPEVMKYVEKKKKEYEKVLSVRPGITDYAAIEFRDEEEILNRFDDTEKAYIEKVLPKKIELYYQYIDNVSFINDIKVILKTLKVI